MGDNTYLSDSAEEVNVPSYMYPLQNYSLGEALPGKQNMLTYLVVDAALNTSWRDIHRFNDS